MNESNDTANISLLPEGCLSETLSLTSPRDASRAAAISKEFKVASDSVTVWERFLPSDIYDIISRAVSPVVFSSKKQLYLCLSDSHILLDHGNLSFKLDKESGKKYFMLGARDLSIAWEDDIRYWEWGKVPESRFSEVGILRNVCWLEIRGKVAAAMLSQNTTYVVYLVFQLTSDSKGLVVPAKTMVSFAGLTNEANNVYLKRPRRLFRVFHVTLQVNGEFPRKRKDGWMEIKLGEFYCDEGDDGEVEMVFEEIRHGNWKSGLIVEGMELRPK